MSKSYLRAKPAPTRKTLTYIKTVEHKQNPNLHEKTLPYQLNELSSPQLSWPHSSRHKRPLAAPTGCAGCLHWLAVLPALAGCTGSLLWRSALARCTCCLHSLAALPAATGSRTPTTRNDGDKEQSATRKRST